jgi:hypothetical protein
MFLARVRFFEHLSFICVTSPNNAELPDDVLLAFNASYFLALHKKIGLQPILIGTSLK